ncbi:hypothetical protein N2601_31765 (plasmid) [Rhizobium sp. CB3060]|uniref:hypothetical protein n=1 Tax=Rhizobium sp. CB3060 TaxID=3138255 RepID=UPI0021A442F4|nr:hypothetical protein [Rhizobium tropici]UWU25548.1 hypothetical protein N2601_31765 [Rhizobium tropici]
MNSNKRRHCVIATVLAILAVLTLESPASAYSVYRGVVANPFRHVIWDEKNFGVSGATPSLSFFHYVDDAAARAALSTFQCIVKIDLGNIDPPPAPGHHSLIGNADIAVGAFTVDQPRVFPWQIYFDNNPAGHWSIASGAIFNGKNNNAASRVAAAGIANLVFNDPNIAVINGNTTGCSR